jgi:hypothetical protein
MISMAKKLCIILELSTVTYRIAPTEASAAFVAAMEDVLEVYHHLPHDRIAPRNLAPDVYKQTLKRRRAKYPTSDQQIRRRDVCYCH